MSKSLFKSTVTVGFMTLLSRILGLMRETAFAALFGASAGMDAFLVAFRIPNFLRRLFAEGSFSQAFVPVLAEYKTKYSEAEMQNLVRHTEGTLGGILVIVTLAGVIFAPLFVMIFAPGFIHQPQKFAMASEMLRITFPYLLCISLAALSAGVLNTYGHFSIPAFTPTLLNIVMVMASYYLAPYFGYPEMAAAWGVFIAGIVQMLFQFPFLYRIKMLHWPKWGWHHPGVQKILKLMLPALFGASIYQISMLIDTSFASFLPTGSVSWLYYADRLMQFPLGVFGVALGTVVLPHFSAKHTTQDLSGFNDSLDWAMRIVLLIAVPASVGLMVLAVPMTVTVFAYGKFDPNDTIKTAWAVAAFGYGLVFFSWVKVLVSAYYSRQDTRTPVRAGALALAVSLIMNLILIWPFKHVGLALAVGMSAMANGGLLYWGLRKKGIYHPKPGWGKLAVRVVIANLIMAAFLYFLKGDTATWLGWHAWHRAGYLCLLILIAMLLYFAVLYVLGMRKRDFVH